MRFPWIATFRVAVLALLACLPAFASGPGFGVVQIPDNTSNLDPGVAIQGVNPFYPSRAGTDGRNLTSGDFESTQLCSGCHMDIFTQWKGSMHSNAWKDPVYRAALSVMSNFSHG